MANDDSDFLMISGLKHFQFCRRREKMPFRAA